MSAFTRLQVFLKLCHGFTLRPLARHRLRAGVVLLGIALGAGLFTSVRLSVRASLDAFSSGVSLLSGSADGVLTQPGGRVPEKVLGVLRSHPGLAALAPFSSAYVRQDKFEAPVFLLLGIDPLLDRAFRDWQARSQPESAAEPWADLMSEPYSILVSPKLAAENGWSPGDRIPLVHADHREMFTILGVLNPQGLALADGGRMAIADIATFQEFTGSVGRLDRIDLRKSSAVTELDLAALQESLPSGLQLATASAARERGQAMIQAYQLNLSVLSLAALFVGMFLVYSLVALNVAARRKEIAILGALGGSRRTVFLLFLVEGGIMGLGGWLLSLPLAGLLIPFLLTGISRTIDTLFVRVVVSQAAFSPGEVALSLLVTVGISLLAAFKPASEAMWVMPAEALPEFQSSPPDRIRPAKLAAGGGLAIACAALLCGVPPLGEVPLPGYLGMLALFIGFALLAPGGIRLVGRTLGKLLYPLGAAPAFLAGRYVRCTGAQTAISVGALITAVALYSALVIMIHSFRNTVELWVRQTISGDLFVTTRNAEANQRWEPMTPGDMAVLKELAAARGATLVASRRFSLTTPETPFQLDFLDLDSFQHVGRFIWLRGDPQALMAPLIAGKGVVISEVFANRTGLGIGDHFEAHVDGIFLKSPILGIIRDYRTRGGVVFASLPGFSSDFGGLPWGAVRIFLNPASGDSSRAVARFQTRIVDRLGDRFDMYSGTDLRAAVLRIFDETFAVTGLLLLIALAVAALGITTTMTVLVLQRIRQINTIRALGGSSGQVRRMILWETVLIVLAGELAGLICGFLLSYILVFVINRQSFGWTFLYGVEWRALALSLPLILATALGAALPAVGAAFKQPPAMLLQER